MHNALTFDVLLFVFAVRFAGKSEVCKRLAGDIAYVMEREAELFSFRQTHDTPPLLLVG